MVEFAMTHAWLVPLLPFLAFVVIVFLTRPWKMLSALVSVGAMAAGFVISAYAAYGVFTSHSLIEKSLEYSVRWFSMPGLHIDVGVKLDPTSAMMLFMVTLVASLIQIYSIGYMRGEKGFSTFFAYMSLFGASMLLLVISSNLLEMFVAWEGVGLCSYLLIGFYNHKISAREAAKKAFVTCRIADFGLLLGMLALQIIFGTLNITELGEKIANFELYTNAATLTLVAVLVFLGPIGKSGQFPLHVWLPDAMEGPTPVSALIHAATMVVAGVYLVGRMLFMFLEVPEAQQLVAVTGAFTALFAASIALTQREIKRILAYSTISQLGYMMLALGVGSLTASMFHLWTHAFFKALMFLAAGSVLTALHHKADIWEMGGLIKKMPVTGATFAVGGLAIAGIPPFAGFWSKDEILSLTLSSGHKVLFFMAALTALLTAFYMWRLIFLAFFGKEKPENHPQESPPVMTVPLLILAFLSLVGGLVGTPWFPFWGEWIRFGEFHHAAPDYTVMILSVILGVIGIGLAYKMYVKDISAEERLAQRFKPVYSLLYNKYYIDEIYMWFNHTLVDGAAKAMYLFDIYVVDGIFINGIGAITRDTGSALRVFQTGRLQNYALIFFLGVLAVAVILAITGPAPAGLVWGGVR
ncbi:MAG: NADH-quinone oxidoreductase subunit L [Peptococcaceae bacterium]|nr:MAG: NADH-quinone oxidoreductase subunit L [Peptococcaceae bacterium]